jgi:hypothetical protein
MYCLVLTNTGVDSISVVIKDVIVDVATAESERGGSGVDVSPVVVGVGDGDLGILGAVAVGVSNKRTLPVVVDLASCHRNSSAAVGDIEKAIVAK